MSDSNLFAALRAAFPANLDEAAVEAVSPHGEPLNYSWRDLDRISARMANLYSRSRKWLDRFAGGCYMLFGAHLVANR